MHDAFAVIYVNGVEVGAMPASEYDEIVQSVRNSTRVRIATLLSYVGYIFKLIRQLWNYFVKGFTVIFALFMLYALFCPAEMVSLITKLVSLSPESIANIFHSVAKLCLVIAATSCFLTLVITGLPFVSASERAINKRIREVMEVPSDGAVNVVIKEARDEK